MRNRGFTLIELVIVLVLLSLSVGTSCHSFGPSYPNGEPKANSHTGHNSITCEKCHWITTQTGNSIADASKHVDWAYDIGNSAGTLSYSFATTGGTCSGTFCHNSAVWGGTLVTPDYSNCVFCHSSPLCGRRQIVDSNSNGTGTGGDFKKTSHHHNAASGTATNVDCVVCHDTYQHPRGPIRLKNADTGEIYTYDSLNPATAENHCLSCHDTNGANGNMSPFTDGNRR